MKKLTVETSELVNAYDNTPELPIKNRHYRSLASALRALADEIVPMDEISLRGYGRTKVLTPDEIKADQRAETRRKILRIVYELEGYSNT